MRSCQRCEGGAVFFINFVSHLTTVKPILWHYCTQRHHVGELRLNILRYCSLGYWSPFAPRNGGGVRKTTLNNNIMSAKNRRFCAQNHRHKPMTMNTSTNPPSLTKPRYNITTTNPMNNSRAGFVHCNLHSSLN